MFMVHGFYFIIWLISTSSASWMDRNTLSALVDGVDHTIAACEEDNLMVQCRNKYNKIIIKNTFYGRDNYFTCTNKIFKADKLCSEPTPQSVVEKVNLMCSNENKCKIPVTSTFLEKDGNEICPDIRKYLKVTYSCHQYPHLQMICQNGCSSSCWPLCEASCCNPSLPNPLAAPVEEKVQANLPEKEQKIISIHHGSFMISPQQCGNGCPSSCAPLCQPTCCQSQIPTLMMAPMTVSMCPGDCSGACLPLCDPTCCATKKKQQSSKQGKIVKPLPLSCPGSCSAACAPACDLQCCAQQNQCPSGCPQSCTPSCSPMCCSQSMMMQPMVQAALPAQAPTCPMGCPSQCAPLCQPTCCQTPPPMMAPPPRGVCPVGCPASCLPMCQPICCAGRGGGAPPFMAMTPPMQPMIPMQQPMMIPVMQQPQMMPMGLPPQMPIGGCSPMCTAAMCATTCLPRCCISSMEAPSQGVSEDEVSARRTYQEMLKKFRQKQIQNYFRHGQ